LLQLPQPNGESYCEKVFLQSNQLSEVRTGQEQHAYDRLKDQWSNILERTPKSFTEQYQLLLVCINLEPGAGGSTPSSEN